MLTCLWYAPNHKVFVLHTYKNTNSFVFTVINAFQNFMQSKLRLFLSNKIYSETTSYLQYKITNMTLLL